MLVAASALITSACHSRARVPTPDQEAQLAERVAAILNEADRAFDEMHLVGWRKAELLYSEAFELRADDGVHDRLELMRYLVLTREIDEKILKPDQLKRLEVFCSEAKTPRQSVLCNSAKTDFRLEGLISDEPPPYSREEWKTLERLRDGSLSMEYVFLRAMRREFSSVYDAEVGDFLQRDRGSPSSVYLQILGGEPVANLDELLEQNPEFAELWAYRGQCLLGEKHYREALASLEHSLQLVPDYLPVLELLGSTYLYDLQLPEPALLYYRQALQIFPGEAEAALGRGIALHYLGRSVESNEALSSFFSDGIDWTGTRASARNAYLGRAAYFMAYNYFLRGLASSARFWVDRALELTPTLEGAHYLSGVLYFGEHDLARAAEELRQVVEPGTTICDAYFKMGMIAAEDNPAAMDQYFLNNGVCLEQSITGGLERIDEMNEWDLDPSSKATALQSGRRELKRTKSQALASVLSMLKTAHGAPVPRRAPLLDALNRLFERLNAIPVDESAAAISPR